MDVLGRTDPTSACAAENGSVPHAGQSVAECVSRWSQPLYYMCPEVAEYIYKDMRGSEEEPRPLPHSTTPSG